MFAGVGDARQWYAQAAFRGHSAAAFNLFFIHANRGNDDKKDRALAKHWLDEAVKLGEPAAVNVRARKAGLSVSAFLAENARLWGDDAALVERRTRVLLAENGIDADEVPPSPGDVWPPALAPTPAPRPRTVASSDAGAAAVVGQKGGAVRGLPGAAAAPRSAWQIGDVLIDSLTLV